MRTIYEEIICDSQDESNLVYKLIIHLDKDWSSVRGVTTQVNE